MKTKYVQSKDFISQYPMHPDTLLKKALAGKVATKANPHNKHNKLYRLSDGEHAAPPTEKRCREFHDDQGCLWIWIQRIPKMRRYDNVSIPTLYRWEKEGKIRIERREFSGTRGKRDFVSDKELRAVISAEPPSVPDGFLFLEEASQKYHMHEGTIRKLVYEGIVDHSFRRRSAAGGRTVRKMVVRESQLKNWQKLDTPKDDVWVSGPKTEELYAIHYFKLNEMVEQDRLPASCRKKFRVRKANGRSCMVWHFQRRILDSLTESPNAKDLTGQSLRQMIAESHANSLLLPKMAKHSRGAHITAKVIAESLEAHREEFSDNLHTVQNFPTKPDAGNTDDFLSPGQAIAQLKLGDLPDSKKRWHCRKLIAMLLDADKTKKGNQTFVRPSAWSMVIQILKTTSKSAVDWSDAVDDPEAIAKRISIERAAKVPRQ